MLNGQLKPVRKVDTAQIERWLDDLGSNDFQVREKASAQLVKSGESAVEALTKALAAKPSLEVRQRVEKLIERLSPLSVDRLRELRALRVLEQVGTEGARQLLLALAKGAEGARLTRDASASLGRLTRQAPSK